MPNIHIHIPSQTLTLLEKGNKLLSYSISSGVLGTGNIKNSGQTPTGKHVIRAMIGQGEPLNTVFVARRPTAEIYSEALAAQYPNRDWILTRILWLSGCELHKNRLGNCDTMQRYIYIHGCPDSEPMGTPMSHGCIRMRNTDIASLFDALTPGTVVSIES